MDCIPGNELMPLCAAAAIAWGHVVDYPALKLDSAQFDEQLRRMEALLRCLIPVRGEDPAKVRKGDLYQAIKRLRPAPLPLEWWAVQQKKPQASRAVEVRFRPAPAPELRRAA
jgi:hypothetical protein